MALFSRFRRARPDPDDVAAVSVLDEPTRRRIYEFVCPKRDAVSRDEVSEALGIPRQTAAFHLEKLADAGLLDVEFARRSGRSGPGAGRPSKLYRRSAREVSVELPGRSYDIAGALLAQAVEDADRTGESPRACLARGAADLGRDIGVPDDATDEELLAALTECGYEPRIEGDDIVLVNCPFHALAKTHTGLVCGMNLDLLSGVLGDATRPRLDPQEGYCCVRITRR
ncbi:helix-turn-helix transcriptional regulator [Gordonia hydrophobica]|uniref:Helix-turn-helix domain-containing protein n=1 Tax=Gordonia hydrophobica TaxID=40516 RepID=A0ABZ2U4W0_9ACTN|nr:helix-turn-helix domain-containing protein [Gordonia hydrophobica]MBM7369055.1 putative ArsR family transcriptional regulator [Gordonia hydrophobica]